MQLEANVVIAERFRLNRQLGQGGMGSVWHATHLALDIPCAVKFIEGQIAELPEAQARFEREAKAAAQLRSPHVVQILDHGVWMGTPYIAMELLDGEDLGKRILRLGRLAPRDVLRIVYTGQSSKVTPLPDPCSPTDPTATPAAPGNIIGRCDSTLRKTLVGSWGNMFQGGCTNSKCPTGLKHAFRRDDASGTTDTFLTLLGLPKATTRSFCNGFEVEDLDPIRTPSKSWRMMKFTTPATASDP